MLDVNVIINAHCEGGLLLPTLKSVAGAQWAARDAGLKCGVCVMLDRPDDETLSVVGQGKQRDWQIELGDIGDLGLARNAAVRLAEASGYLAFMDGDDLCSANWLAEAAHCAGLHTGFRYIYHPHLNYVFGEGDTYIFQHQDMDDPGFSLSSIAFSNHWTALSFAARSIYVEFPYRQNRLRAGWGFEDWGWNADTVGAGIKHKLVPKTAHFIRRKAVSLSKDTNRARALPHLQALHKMLF